ncbi:MAG: protein tyrosine phosphatase [Roseiflexaceae bacterium]|nr:protein tyrosine phosphatase [Roseiflexaceae bacterium]
MTKDSVLLVGAADTGRAPIAAALLGRLVERRGLDWQVSSAGVLGHDGAPAEAEARAAMLTFGLHIDAHRARSVDDALTEAATHIIAVDSGTARALRVRFPQIAARINALGDLAGRSRDVPDPFRMQVGAWIAYARELEGLLELAMERLAEPVVQAKSEPGAQRGQPQPRAQVVARTIQLLALLVELPEVIVWAAARAQLEADIAAATQPNAPLDAAPAYGGLLRAALALSTSPPSAGQAAALLAAFQRLEHQISNDDLVWLSTQIGGWAAL